MKQPVTIQREYLERKTKETKKWLKANGYISLIDVPDGDSFEVVGTKQLGSKLSGSESSCKVLFDDSQYPVRISPETIVRRTS